MFTFIKEQFVYIAFAIAIVAVGVFVVLPQMPTSDAGLDKISTTAMTAFAYYTDNSGTGCEDCGGSDDGGPTGGGSDDDGGDDYVPNPPSCNISASVDYAEENETFTVSWRGTPSSADFWINGDRVSAVDSADYYFEPGATYMRFTMYGENSDDNCGKEVYIYKDVTAPVCNVSVSVDYANVGDVFKITWNGTPSEGVFKMNNTIVADSGSVDWTFVGPNYERFTFTGQNEDKTCQKVVEVRAKVTGCTDPNASNYNSSANTDDGSCEYPTPLPKCDYLTLTPSSLPYGGGDVVLKWETTNATNVTLNGIAVAANNTTGQTESITDDKTFTILATDNSGNSHSCVKTVAVGEETPESPECPLAPSTDKVIVNFDGDKIRTDQGEANSYTGTKNVNLSAGKYKVVLVGWDGYLGRENTTQPNETYHISFLNNGTQVKRSGTLGDLADMVRETTKTRVTNGQLDISSAVNAVKAVHTNYPDTSSANSLVPICASFEKIPEKTVVTCEDNANFSATPTNLGVGGGDITLSWNAIGVAAVKLDGSVVANNDTKVVNIGSTKTFTLEITGDGSTAGNTISCPIKVEVEKEGDILTCSDVNFTASDTSVKKGQNVVLRWVSTGRVSEVSIDNGIGNVALTGSKTVEINDDITYNITIKNADSSKSCPLSIDVESGGGGGSNFKCDLDISDDKIRRGEEVTLEWNTSNATDITLIDDAGNILVTTDGKSSSKTKDLLDDEINVRPTKDTEYTLIAERGSREKKCRVEVEVSGGVTVLETRNQEPRVAGISLTAVPYTGFEAGPALTMLFYALLTLWALFVAYTVVIRRDSVGGVSLAGAHEHVTYTEASVATEEEAKSAQSYIAAATVAPIPANLPTVENARPVVGYAAYNGEVTETTEVEETEEMSEFGELETLAHNHRTLLSTDALRFIANKYGTGEVANEILETVIDKAKVSFPSEDGWIVLNLSRLESLLGDTAA